MDTVNVDSLSTHVKPPPVENWATVVDSQGLPIITVRKYFHTLEVANFGYGPLPPEILSDLCRHCSYTHKTVPFGYDPEDFDPVTGERYRLKTTFEMLYALDDRCRFTTGFGYLRAILRILSGHRCVVRFDDVTPPHPRPNAFETHFENLRINRIKLRPRQDEFLATMLTHPGGVLQAVVGFGKSFMVAVLALILPYARIIVYVPRRSLIHKMASDISLYVSSVGRIGDGRLEGNARVTVCTLDSIHHTPPDIDIALFDEGHLVCGGRHPEKIGAVFQDSHAKLFTTSATPYSRFDGAHAKLELLFGQRLFLLEYPEGVRLGLVVQIQVTWVAIDIQANEIGSSNNRTKHQRMTVWNNVQRNRAVADVILALPADEQVLVLVDKIEHAILLAKFLPGFTLIYGGIDAKRIEQLRKSKVITEDFVPLTSKQQKNHEVEFRAGRLRKVIATRVWSTGVDFAQLSIVVRASRDSANDIEDEQAPGRSSRLSDGKICGRVIDFWDRWDGKMSRADVDCAANYRRRGWDQTGDVPQAGY